MKADPCRSYQSDGKDMRNEGAANRGAAVVASRGVPETGGVAAAAVAAPVLLSLRVVAHDIRN